MGEIMKIIHEFIKNNIPQLEMTGVLMRIFCFTLVSWLGPASPFLLVWLVNTVDAILLTYCAMLKKDRAYTLLNSFWILVGLVGIARAAGWI
jgi:phosphoglycerol transferase MdoB-like AlkP superfamily enzyme